MVCVVSIYIHFLVEPKLVICLTPRGAWVVVPIVASSHKSVATYHQVSGFERKIIANNLITELIFFQRLAIEIHIKFFISYSVLHCSSTRVGHDLAIESDIAKLSS